MKRIILTLTAIAASAVTMYGQGRVLFNNYVSGNAVTISPGATHVGADYSVQLRWAAGTFADQAAFMAANPSSSAVFAFFGATGGSPGSDGAGLFDGGTVAMGGPAGAYTMQIVAWLNGGQHGSYANAVAAGVNAGLSQLFTVNVTASPTPPANTIVAPFSVSAEIIPEPSTFALAGLGLAGLLLFRRRK